MSSIVQRVKSNVAEMRDDERGAETIEIIAFLALFVLGMFMLWVKIRNTATDKGNAIDECLNNTNTNVDADVAAC